MNAQTAEPTQQEKELYAQQLLVKAMTQSFLGYHDKAIVLYEEALNATPNSATINSALAESYEHMGEYASALFYANQALTLEPSELHFHRHVVSLHIQSGDNIKAEEQLTTLLTQFPNDIESLGDLTEIQVLNGHLERALETNNRLIELEGPEINVLETQLQLLKSLERWDAYETTLMEREQYDPQSIAFKKERAEFYITQNRNAEAIELLNEALSLSPAHPEVSTMLAKLYTENGDEESARTLQTNQPAQVTDPEAAYQSALAMYESSGDDSDVLSSVEQMLRAILDISPNHFDALTLLGTVLNRQGNYSEAGPFLKIALDQNPRHINLWIAAAESYLNLYNYKEAALLAEDALLLFPGQLPLLHLSAAAHIGLHNNATALERSNEYLSLANKSIEANPHELAEIHAIAGLASARLSDHNESDKLFNQALELSPDNPRVLSFVALGLSEQGSQLRKAVEFAHRSVELSPDNALFMAILGRVHVLSNDLDNAEKWLTMAMESEMVLPEAFEYQGDLLLQKGLPREAVSSWIKALELNPDNPILEEKINAHTN